MQTLDPRFPVTAGSDLEAAVSWVRDELDEERRGGPAANATALDICQKLARFGSLSPKQEAFLIRLHQESEAKRQRAMLVALGLVDAPPPTPEGRATVEGVVRSVKWVDSAYGEVTKMLVELSPDGPRVYGTCPNSLWDALAEEGNPAGEEGLRGKAVRFTATFTPSSDDPNFAFFSRPVGAELVKED